MDTSGRKQEVERARLTRAFPLAAEISVTVQELYYSEQGLADWFTGNFRHIRSLPDAVRYIEDNATFRSGAAQAKQVTELRNGLRAKVRSARIYLNSQDLDRIEEYCALGDFTYESDGMGGVMFNTWLVEFFGNLMDPSKRLSRTELYTAIKKRLNRMHEI